MELTFKTIMVSYCVSVLCVLLGFGALFVSAALSQVLLIIGASMFLAASIASVVSITFAIIMG